MGYTSVSQPRKKGIGVNAVVTVAAVLGALGLIRLGSFVLTGLSSPPLVPEPAAVRSVEGWGQFFDPDGDCRLATEGDKLTIEVPGSLHDLSAEYRKVNAPRILRQVEGDFVASVRVIGNVKPGGNRVTTYAYPYHGAGILVWQDSNNYVRLERAAILRGTKVVSYLNFERRQGGRNIQPHAVATPDAPLYLRLERQGNRLLASFSPDGQRWSRIRDMVTNLDPVVKVGVSAVNTSTSKFPAEFEKYSVTRSKLIEEKAASPNPAK